jgi:(-)-germacrene D synthase
MKHEMLWQRDSLFPAHFLRQKPKITCCLSYVQFQTLSKYYLQGAEWFHHNYMPTFKEKQEVGFMDSGSPFSVVALLVGMGDLATKEVLEWAIGCTDAVKACGELTRYMNDISALKV